MVAPVLRAPTTGAPCTAAELDAALDAGRLTVLFQPVVDLHTGAVVAAEALARLTADHGLVPPDEFVPLAERTGRIRRIDRLVLEQAVPLCARWRRQLGGRPFSVGVNISVPDLDPGLADVVRALTNRHGVPADAIVLELTETVLSTSGAGHANALRAVAALGCNVTLDDFGTGYSSLTHLRRFPVSGIKIDRQFVWDLDGSPAAARIARAIVRFGRDLGMHVVAEGIETRTQLAALQEAGCAFGQGYLFARPLPADELTAYLRRANRLPLPRSGS